MLPAFSRVDEQMSPGSPSCACNTMQDSSSTTTVAFSNVPRATIYRSESMDQGNSQKQTQRDEQKSSDQPPQTAIERESLCAQFPLKLHKILEDAEKLNFASAISWMDDGKAFVIIDKNRLENEIMPRYFMSGKWKSFQRSLNMWGFKCDRTHRVILPGPGYRRHHPLFLRGKIDLCYKMRRNQADKTPIKFPKKKKKTDPTFPQQPFPAPLESPTTPSVSANTESAPTETPAVRLTAAPTVAVTAAPAAALADTTPTK